MVQFRSTPGIVGSRPFGRAGGPGSVRSSVRVLGVPQALAKLKGVDSVARLDLGLLMKGAAEFVEKRAKEYLEPHRETGNLIAGTKSEKLASYTYQVTSSSMDGDVPEKNSYEYAPYLEEGVSGRPAVHYMARAAQDVKPLVAVELKAIARKLERL